MAVSGGSEFAGSSFCWLEQVFAQPALRPVRSKRNKDFCWFWWASFPLFDQWPMKVQVSPLLAPSSSSGRAENAPCEPVPEQGIAQHFPWRRENTCFGKQAKDFKEKVQTHALS